MNTMIPYGRQDISEADIQAVVDVLRSDFLTQGPAVPAFEERIANYCQANFALAVNSATSALHIACLALEVGPGDVVWTSPITFVASANCALYCGATVDFVDINPVTYNMCADRLEEKLEVAKKKNCLPKVVIPVHLCGEPCDMERIKKLGDEYGFKIIEDASHAIGGSYLSRKIGDCTYSDIVVFSFHPVKIITSAEGGMAITNDAKLAKHMTLLRSHGISKESLEMTQVPDGPWYYEQLALGFNYRMTDLQAALGLSQTQRLDEFVVQRHEICDRYAKILEPLPVKLPFLDPRNRSALHLYVIRLKLEEIEVSHKDVFERMRNLGVGVNLHYMPVYLQPYYKQFGFKKGYCVEAEKYYEEAISLPMYPNLSEPQQHQVVGSLIKAVSL